MDGRLLAEICAGLGVVGTIAYTVVGWRIITKVKDWRRRNGQVAAPGSSLHSTDQDSW